MKSDRRQFIRQLSAGTGSLLSLPAIAEMPENLSGSSQPSPLQTHHMCGYAAPRMNTVRIGVVGLGHRGSFAVERLSYIDGVEIVALCDKYPDRVEQSQQTLEKMGRPRAKAYSGEEGWKDLCDNHDLDLVYTPTPWHLHTPIAVRAMLHGKHAATEVPAALTIEEAWQLVETSEKTRRHCMMLENCCYDFFELLTLNMTRQGLFGEMVHAEGSYIHTLATDLFNKNGYADMWRLKQNASHNGNLYPTHGLGPIAQCLGINRGDKMDYLVSMSTRDFTLGPMARDLAATDPFYKPYAGKAFRGNMNTTLIQTARGKTIKIQHDISSPRVYSRIHLLSGTRGSALKYPEPERIAFGHEWIAEEELKKLYDTYSPPIVRHIGELAKQVGGHGGMDFMMDWRLIDCLRNGLPLDQDVYDAASWSCLYPLSAASLGKRSGSVDIPDFTRGNWKTNQPHSLSLESGGSTGVRTAHLPNNQ